jgi:lipopolysaccharide transport system ATP-binding protein
VGDIAFQKKCLGKMEDVATHGRTVLFVSHNLSAVRELCQTGIILKDGMVDFAGPVVQGVAHYSKSIISSGENGSAGKGSRWRQICVNGLETSKPVIISSAEPFSVEAVLENDADLNDGRFFCRIYDATGKILLLQKIGCEEMGITKLRAGVSRIQVECPPLWLAPGVYTLLLKFVAHKPNGEEVRHKTEPVILDVTGKETGKNRAVLAPPLRWSLTGESCRDEIRGLIGKRG